MKVSLSRMAARTGKATQSERGKNMSVMDRVVKSMVGGMSVELKQKMMLKMMPMMMEDVNMAETMVEMVPLMADEISLLDIFAVIKKLFPRILSGVGSIAELLGRWDEISLKLFHKLPETVGKMMPLMELVMPKIMAKLMPLLMTEQFMQTLEGCAERIIPKMMADENLRVIMPEMMTKIMPKCLENILPQLPEKGRLDFISSMKSLLESSGQIVYSPA